MIVLMQVAQVIYMGCLRGAGDVRFTTISVREVDQNQNIAVGKEME